MYVVVVQKFTFAISSPDEFLYILTTGTGSQSWWRLPTWSRNVDKNYVVFCCIRV